MSDELKCVFEIDPDNEVNVICVRGGCPNRMLYVEGLPMDRYHPGTPCGGGRPNVLRRGANYTKAEIKDLKAGRPRRTYAEFQAILAICQSNRCGLYNAQGQWCEHKNCGCKMRKKAIRSVEKCPAGLW